MKKLVKEIISIVFRFIGLPYLIREVIIKNKVTILVYHNPQNDVFQRHLKYLSKNYNFIALHELVKAIIQKDWSVIPEKSVIVTIDDGFKENYLLLDDVKKYNIYPTIYVCSHFINTNRKLWFNSGYPHFRKLKKYDHKLRLKKLSSEIDYNLLKNYPQRESLNFIELSEMLPYFDIQSHSKFHPILPTCNSNDCKAEIGESKSFIEKKLDKRIDHFCYPNGDYTEREVVYVKNFGYKSARTLDCGWNDINTNLYRLKAMIIDDDASISMLSTQITGFFQFIRYLKYDGTKGRRPLFI